MLACCIKHDSVEKSLTLVPHEVWIGKLDFFMSVMGFNIGLGNILRFPYLCMKNGGGAFLVPYFFFLVTIGIPMFLMEMSLAQYSGMTPLDFYGNLCPLMKGIGWCNVLACGIYNMYYNMLMAWIIFYIGASFINPLPWLSCNNEWNTENCQIPNTYNSTNKTVPCNVYRKKFTSPAEEYWEKEVLQLSSGLGEMGSMNWLLVLCLVVGWVFVFLCVFKGIKSMGRVVYVTALSPYIFILVLLVKGCTLPGSGQGIIFFLWPRLSILLSPKVWMEAGQQIFWSLAPGWGITITLASYNCFHHNIYRDSIMLPVVSCMTSFLSGFVIFTFIGHIAYSYNEAIICSFKVGPGLAFNVYPGALQLLPLANIWCFLFFLLLFVLGLDSSFTSFETVYDSVRHNYPSLMQHDLKFKVAVILITFTISLPLTMEGGYYLFQLIDYYQIAFIPLVSFCEVIVIAHVYGSAKVKENIKIMTGYSISIFWDIIWKYVLPVLLVILLVFTLATQGDLTYGSYIYPKWSITLGWILAIIGFIPIPVYFLYKLFKIRGLANPPNLNWEIVKPYFMATNKWNLEENINCGHTLKPLSKKIFEENLKLSNSNNFENIFEMQ